MKRIAVLMIVAGIGFAGGAGVSAQGLGGPATPTKCGKTKECLVTVAVVFSPDKTGCVFTPIQPVHVRGKMIPMFWEMSGTSTEFYFKDRVGISIKPKEDPPPPEFDSGASQNHGKRFKLMNKNGKATSADPLTYKTYNYNIKVDYLLNGKLVDCQVYDPIIVNEGS